MDLFLTGKEEEEEDHDGGVSKVEECGCGPLDLQLGHEVVYAVDEQVEGGEAGCQEGPPPPVVVLGAEVEVAEQDGRLGASDEQNDEDEEEEAVHVVDLRGPDRVEDEEELDEDAAEGEDAAHDDARDGLCVNTLVRDLPGDLICPHRVFKSPLPAQEIILFNI